MVNLTPTLYDEIGRDIFERRYPADPGREFTIRASEISWLASRSLRTATAQACEGW
jgi:hypothetical protein